MKEKLAALYALQQLDTALDALRRQHAAIDVGKAEHAAYEAARAAHAEAETALHNTHAALRDAELEQKAVEEKRADYETRLYSGKITAAKELQAMQEEIAMLGRQRSRLDEKILALMDELEASRVREAETKAAQAAAVTAFRTKNNAAKEQVETITAQFHALTSQRAEDAKQIAPDLMKRYDSLRASRGGLAIVPVVDGNTCGGCRMGLPTNLVERVHEGVAIQVCNNCQRILCEEEKQ
jgi:predicted  nucleic acid-binding Zn-ribbon protein